MKLWRTSCSRPQAHDLTLLKMEMLSLRKPELGRVEVSTAPAKVTAEDSIKLTVMYTATADLADEDPDGDASTTDATFGIIQVMLPEEWTTTKENVAVTYSSSVELAADGTDRDYLTVNVGREIIVDIDSLTTGKFVKVTVDKLRVPDFSSDEAGDKLYAQVMVYSDQVGDDRGIKPTEVHPPVQDEIQAQSRCYDDVNLSDYNGFQHAADDHSEPQVSRQRQRHAGSCGGGRNAQPEGALHRHGRSGGAGPQGDRGRRYGLHLRQNPDYPARRLGTTIHFGHLPQTPGRQSGRDLSERGKDIERKCGGSVGNFD